MNFCAFLIRVKVARLSTSTLVYRNFCLSLSSPQYILLAVAIASVKVSFRGTCNIYRGERSGSKRERTRGNSRQLPFQTGVKSHNLVMGKFVRSDRELFPHLADTRCDRDVVHEAQKKLALLARRAIR